jgi:hypothetical protein
MIQNSFVYFSKLPDEIQLHILRQMDRKSLTNYCLTNTDIRKFCVNEFGFRTIHLKSNFINHIVTIHLFKNDQIGVILIFFSRLLSGMNDNMASNDDVVSFLLVNPITKQRLDTHFADTLDVLNIPDNITLDIPRISSFADMNRYELQSRAQEILEIYNLLNREPLERVLDFGLLRQLLVFF